MKAKVGILMYLLVASILIQANDTFPEGTGDVVRKSDLMGDVVQKNDLIPEGTEDVVQKNNTIPEGWWNVVQVTVEQNTDGKVEKGVYANAAEVESDIQCPQEWLIIHAPRGILLRYADGSENLYRYDIEDNQLIISIDDNTKYVYQYEIKGEEVTLTTVHEQPGKNEQRKAEKQNVEQWTITLRKQERNINN